MAAGRLERLTQRDPVGARLVRVAREATRLCDRREGAQQIVVIVEVAPPDQDFPIADIHADTGIDRADRAVGDRG